MDRPKYSTPPLPQSFLVKLAFKRDLWKNLEQGRPSEEKDQTREHLNKFDLHKSTIPDEIHLQVQEGLGKTMNGH